MDLLSLFLNAKSPVPAYQYMSVRGVRMRRISEIFLYSLIVYSCEERNIAKALLFQTVTRIVYCFAKVPISSRNQHPPRLAILESTFASSMPSAPKSVKIVFAFWVQQRIWGSLCRGALSYLEGIVPHGQINNFIP